MSPHEEIAESDRLRDAVFDAVGRVVGRLEMHDETEPGARGPHLAALLDHCRTLKAAVDAHTAFVLKRSKS